LINAAGRGLILGDEVKVHAKGMREALECRELLGHEDHPELSLQEEAASFTTLAEPLPFSYLSLTHKHLDEKMHPGTLLSLSTRRAIVEVTSPLESYANILLRLKAGAGDEDSELYAKVIHLLDESIRRYLIHFTSVSPAVQGRLQRLTDGAKGS
jgi:hypothetical protein